MLDLIGGGLAAILSGGATGLLGIGLQRLFDHWKLKQELDQMREKHAHEQKMREIDVQLMKEEWAQRVRVAQVEGETAREVADSQAFAASFQTEPKRYSEGVKVGKAGAFLLVLADVLRAIVRPGLTVYLAWISTEIYNASQAILAMGDLDGKTLAGLHQQIVLTLLYLFVTCVTWWFGTRNKAPQPKLG